MQFLNFLPAFCLISAAISAPIQESKPDPTLIKYAWTDLQSAYNRLDTEFKSVRPGQGAYGRSGVPQASNNIVDIFQRTQGQFAPMSAIGSFDAAMLWNPARDLQTSIQNVMKDIKASKRAAVQSGERANIHTMLQQQLYNFQQWSAVLVRVLPTSFGQQNTGEIFIKLVVSQYTSALSTYERD